MILESVWGHVKHHLCNAILNLLYIFLSSSVFLSNAGTDEQIEASKQQEKRYDIAYKEKRKAYSRNYFLTEYKNNDLFKLKHLCRCSVNRAFRGIKQNKNLTSLSIVGCDNWETLKNYIESMFIEGMTWENYGPNGWHVDHITPLFTAKTEEDIFKLCHYTNLQPLWAQDNLKKGKK